MPTSVPTTRPPQAHEWFGWSEIVGKPPWMYARIEVWRPGWRQTHKVAPVMFVDQPADLMWRPAGRLLSAADVVKRLAR